MREERWIGRLALNVFYVCMFKFFVDLQLRDPSWYEDLQIYPRNTPVIKVPVVTALVTLTIIANVQYIRKTCLPHFEWVLASKCTV